MTPTAHPTRAAGPGKLRNPPSGDPGAARRRLAGTVREHGTLLGAGLAIWCDTPTVPDAAMLTADLTLLQIPHRALRAVRPPRRPRRPPRAGVEVRIAQGRPLQELQDQIPLALRQATRSTPADSEFDLAAWELRAEGAAVPAGAMLGLAADWPTWQDWQATEMGLACTGCRTDLRPRTGDDIRPAFLRDPNSASWPVRLLCGACRRRCGGRRW
ncbi:hypothetical protein ACWEO1_16750 [Kitasatospora cineracea]